MGVATFSLRLTVVLSDPLSHHAKRLEMNGESPVQASEGPFDEGAT